MATKASGPRAKRTIYIVRHAIAAERSVMYEDDS
jgi:hypothetical protein